MAGVLATLAWCWMLVAHTALPLPAALALGAIGLVATVWADAVVFPAPRPDGTPVAPGRLPRDQALAEASGWASQPSLAAAPRPVTRPRSAKGAETLGVLPEPIAVLAPNLAPLPEPAQAAIPASPSPAPIRPHDASVVSSLG